MRAGRVDEQLLLLLLRCRGDLPVGRLDVYASVVGSGYILFGRRGYGYVQELIGDDDAD